MKKMIALCLVAVMALSLCACNFKSTKTTTVTTTAADGTTKTESTTVTNDNGTITTTTRNYKTISEAAADGETHTVPLNIFNDSTKYTIVGFYITEPGATESGNNLFGDTRVTPGLHVTGITLSYNKDAFIKCDVGILVEGESAIKWFSDVNFGNDNSELLEMRFCEEGDGSWGMDHK